MSDTPNDQIMFDQPDETGAGDRHWRRFRRVSARYPLRVCEACNGDIERAALDSDGVVANRLADWERQQGLKIRN